MGEVVGGGWAKWRKGEGERKGGFHGMAVCSELRVSRNTFAEIRFHDGLFLTRGSNDLAAKDTTDAYVRTRR